MAGLPQVLEFYSTLKNVPWGKVNCADLQKWIDDPQRLAIELLEFLKNFPQADTAETRLEVQPILRRLYENETIIIAPCDGSRFIGTQDQVFKGHIDSSFKSWNLNRSGKSTEATEVSVHEMTKNATFTQMFGSLGVPDLNKLCLSQDQIVEFCKNHPQRLRSEGYATFFLFKENENFFVADVRVSAAGLYVRVDRFEYDSVWYGEYRLRLVVPQLIV